MAWNGSDTKGISDTHSKIKQPTNVRNRSKGVFAALFVFLAICLAVTLYYVTDSEVPQKKTSPQKDTHRKIVAQSPVKVRTPKTTTNAVVSPVSPKKADKPEFKKRPGALQLPSGRVLTFPAPKEGEFRMVHSHGKIYKCDHLGNFEDVTPKPVFDNAFEENLIGMSLDRGTFIPGLLMGLDEKAVLEMLKKPVEIHPDDPDDVAEKKRSVAETKELALKYMERTGASFDDFVMDMRKLAVEERGIRGQAMREIVGLLKEGKTADAVTYRNQLNAELKKEGYSPVKLPARINELLEDSNAQ